MGKGSDNGIWDLLWEAAKLFGKLLGWLMVAFLKFLVFLLESVLSLMKQIID